MQSIKYYFRRVQYLTIWDLVLTPIYLLVLSYMARQHRDKRYPPGHPLRKYFLPGLYVKFAGAIFIALIYQYYYLTGDTFNFFYHSQVINSALDDSFGTWLKLLFRVSPDQDPQLYHYVSQMFWYTDRSSYTVAIVGAVFGLLNGTTYLPIALLFAYISYTGIWAMYRTFVNVYPRLVKELAIAFLFIPSTFVWGSAVFKDTLCMFGLGWMTYTTFRIFVNRDFSLKNVFLLVFSFYLVAIVKAYILLAFLPALSLWLLMSYSGRIRSSGLRWVTNIFLTGITIAGFLFFSQRFSNELNRYSLEKILKTAETTRGWIITASEAQEGSGYDLGPVDGSLRGTLSKAPAAISVTLYRPFLWESKKPIMLLSALESFGFLCFTLLIVFKRGLGFSIRKIIKDPNLLFFFIYSVIFAFAVGLSTGNFGTLSRYKIPCMPFFAALLVVLYYHQHKKMVPAYQATAHGKRTSHHFA